MNLSHPRSPPLPPGKKPRRGQTPRLHRPQGHNTNRAAKIPKSTSEGGGGVGRGGGVSLKGKPSCAATHAPCPPASERSPTAHRVVQGTGGRAHMDSVLPSSRATRSPGVTQQATRTDSGAPGGPGGHGCAAKLGGLAACCVGSLVVGGGVEWIHGYERKGEIGWFYSSSLLLEGKKLNGRTRQVSLLGGRKTSPP